MQTTTALRHRLHRLPPLLLALALAAAPLQAPLAQVRLPSLGDAGTEEFSVGTERRVGEQIMREVRRDLAYLDEPVLLEYVQSLWNPLLAAARQRGDIEPDATTQFSFEIFLVADRSVNAFALPGGFVGVHLGLIALTASGDELASVLAHELTHVTQRHIARRIGDTQRTSMASMAAMILGILVAARANNPDMANAAIVGSQAATIQGQLNFSRDMEREADRMGYGLLGDAGFAPIGMAQMFEKLDNANRINDSGNYPYLRSHPLTVERMSEARSRALFNGNARGALPLRHALMQQRARVLMDTDPQTLRRLQEQAAPAAAPLRDRLASAYAGALAASLLRDHATAERLAGTALALAAQAEPREPQAERAVRLLQAQVRLARGDARAALQALDGIGTDAGARAPLLLRAQAALGLQQQDAAAAAPLLRQVTESLQTWVAEHGQDAGAWGLLGSTADAIGLRLRALRAQAESRAAIGDLGGAIDRLRAGQEAARTASGQDFIEASVIDARLRELTAQRRQLMLDARNGNGP
ncbi:M48 family metalloprotease [Rubrivivax sp. RP6-9]|uniref:M48 family metalloprotease n=1 Tax=Rubrivivax sp. RP6-9 TaxID=3415750 RepID=UPI003CC5ED23